MADRIWSEHGISADEVTCNDGDFNSWVESGQLGRFVAQMSERAL